MTNQPPPDPYGQQPQYGQQPDPYGQGSPTSPGQQPGYPQSGYQQPGYQQPGYQQPGYPPPASGGGTNILAILSLVFAFIFAPAAIVLGHIAKKQIAERGEEGSGLATAGLILGYVFTGLALLSCCGVFGLAMLAESTTTY